MAAAALACSAFAATETYTCSALGDANVNPLQSFTVGQVTFSFDKGEGSTAPAYYANGNDVRLYANNVMTVTAAEGYKVEKLVFTLSNIAQLGTVTPSSGTFAETKGETTASWTGDASSLTLTVSAKADFGTDATKAGQFRFASVEVTYSEGTGEVVPDQPTVPVEVYTVEEALALAADLAADETTDKIQIKGYVTSITELSTQYGNATYYISDDAEDAGAEQLLVYRGYGLDGAKFTSTSELKVGALVVVEGKIINFKGNTIEVNTGSSLVSYTAPEGDDDPDQPTEPDQPDVPTTGGIVLDDWANQAWQGGVDGYTATIKGFEVTTEKGESTTDLIQPDQYSIRVYQGSTITVTTMEEQAFDKVVFGVDAKYTKAFTGTPSTGWTATEGSEDNPQFVCTSTNGGQNSITVTAEKQIRISSITIYLAQNSGIESVITENAPVEYFNLQGIRVANPENGIFIRRQGNTVTKVRF